MGDEEKVRLGGLVPPFFYSFCFEKLGLERIYAEMLYFNTAVIDLHRLHGYEFCPERGSGSPSEREGAFTHRDGIESKTLRQESCVFGRISPSNSGKPEENKVEPLTILLRKLQIRKNIKKSSMIC